MANRFLTGLPDAFHRCWFGIIAHYSGSGCGYVFATDKLSRFVDIRRVLMTLGGLALCEHCAQEVRDGALVTLLPRFQRRRTTCRGIGIRYFGYNEPLTASVTR